MNGHFGRIFEASVCECPFGPVLHRLGAHFLLRLVVDSDLLRPGVFRLPNLRSALSPDGVAFRLLSHQFLLHHPTVHHREMDRWSRQETNTLRLTRSHTGKGHKGPLGP